VAISVTVFSRVRFSAVTHFLSTSCLPMLATNCWRISPEADGESVCLPFPPSCFDTRWKTHHRCEYYRLFDFAWASCIFRIFVVRAALVRFPLPDRWIAKRVLKPKVYLFMRTSKKRGVNYLLRFRLWTQYRCKMVGFSVSIEYWKIEVYNATEQSNT
jgi:hypothetical protein